MDQQSYFDQISRQLIKEWIATRKEESLHLEFKSVADSELSRGTDKKILSKSVSSFANSDGGIVVWGIRTNKDSDGIDYASSLPLVGNCRKFLSRLNELTGECTSPIVDRVVHKAIFFNEIDGCVASLIPASTIGPHMAKFGEDRYFKRSGHRTYVMEHFDILDMLGRRQRPNLTLHIEASESDVEDALKISVRLKNNGRAIAKYAGFFIKFPNQDIEIIKEPIGNAQNVSYLNDNVPCIAFSATSEVFHPNNLNYVITELHIKRLRTDPILIRCSVYCEHMANQDMEMHIP